MSLINQMLSDLEERHSHAPEQDPLVLGGLSSINHTGFRCGAIPYNLLIVCFFTAAVAIAAYGFFPAVGRPLPTNPQSPPMPAPDDTTPAASRETHAPGIGGVDTGGPGPTAYAGITSPSGLKLDLALPVADTAAPAEILPPAVVRGITLDRAGEVTHLQLSLDHPPKYIVYSLSSPDRAVLELTGVRLDAPVPDVTGHPYIQRFRYSSRAGGKFLLVADSILPVRIEGARLDDRDDGVLLTVRLSAGAADLANPVTVAEVPAGPERTDTARIDVKTSATRSGGNADRLLAQARMHYTSGAYREADEKILALLNQDPLHVEGRLTYFSSLVKRGDNAAAARVLEAGLKASPGVAEWAKIYARLLVNQGQTVRAVDVLAAALPDIDTDADYHAFYAALLQRLSRHAEAVEYYRALVRRRAENGLWWMGLGISLDALRKASEALQSYRNALADETLDFELRQYILQQVERLSR